VLGTLAQLPALEELNLRHTQLDEGSLAKFRDLPCLKVLDLSRTSIVPADLAALAGAGSLEVVSVNYAMFEHDAALAETRRAMSPIKIEVW
jgi:hypothetical protein